MLEAFADKVDGTVSFVNMFCIHSIECMLKEELAEADTSGKYPTIANLKETKFLTSGPESVIETCLTILSIISY